MLCCGRRVDGTICVFDGVHAANAAKAMRFLGSIVPGFRMEFILLCGVLKGYGGKLCTHTDPLSSRRSLPAQYRKAVCTSKPCLLVSTTPLLCDSLQGRCLSHNNACTYATPVPPFLGDSMTEHMYVTMKTDSAHNFHPIEKVVPSSYKERKFTDLLRRLASPGWPPQP